MRGAALVMGLSAGQLAALRSSLDAGFAVLDAESAKEAISLVGRLNGSLEVVVLNADALMGDSLEVLAFMRSDEGHARIPVVATVKSDDEDASRRLYEAGADAVVIGSYNLDLVSLHVGRITRLLSRARQPQEQDAEGAAQTPALATDSLTGLMNMEAFLEAAQDIVSAATEDDSLYVTYTNITNFKYYNVQFGFESGNQLIKFIADCVGRSPANLLCARFGEDHIVVLTRAGLDTIENGVRKIARQFDDEYGRFGMRFKAGSFLVKGDDMGVAGVCELAKLACDSLNNAATSFRLYDDELRNQAFISTYVIHSLDDAIKNRYIKVFYQPVVRTLSGKTCGMEALVRWIDPTIGFLSPGQFIEVLENNRLISRLTRYVVRVVCADMAEQLGAGGTAVPISINLSRVDFQECDIFSEVDAIRREYNIPPSMINIEVTETAMMSDADLMRRGVRRFREAGYQVWMDDFGSGYSSLNMLMDNQVDEIKLDFKFMASFDDSSKKIVKAIISMAKDLDIQTLAEGVETQEQYDFLLACGCEKIQGFLFSRPLPLAELKKGALLTEEAMEHEEWRGYYDKVGAIDLNTDRALGIVEHDGKRFRYLYMSPAHRAVHLGTAADSIDTVVRNMSDPASPVSRMFTELANRCRGNDDEHPLVYTMRDHMVSTHVRRIAEQGDTIALTAEITDLTESQDGHVRTELDKVGRMLFGMYETVIYYDLVSDDAQLMLRGDFALHTSEHELADGRSFKTLIFTLCGQIHPDQQDAFVAFCDRRTLHDRVAQAGQPYILDFFRTLTEDGTYEWRAYKLLLRSDLGKAILCSYRIDPEILGRSW